MNFSALLKQKIADWIDGLMRFSQNARMQRLSKKFKEFGKGSIIHGPTGWVLNPEFISIGSSVTIHPHIRLVACEAYQESGQTFQPVIRIGDGTNIGWYVSIQANNRVIIGKNVMLGSYVSIADLGHTFEDITLPISQQPLTEGGYVVIGDGSYIGNRSVILSKVTIGKNSVVGAGSVVTKDVPDYTVVAGNPAKVIRYYDTKSKSWIKNKSRDLC